MLFASREMSSSPHGRMQVLSLFIIQTCLHNPLSFSHAIELVILEFVLDDFHDLKTTIVAYRVWEKFRNFLYLKYLSCPVPKMSKSCTSPSAPAHPSIFSHSIRRFRELEDFCLEIFSRWIKQEPLSWKGLITTPFLGWRFAPEVVSNLCSSSI